MPILVDDLPNRIPSTAAIRAKREHSVGILAAPRWEFELNDNTATVPVKDSDYLYFGWWKMVPVIAKNLISSSSPMLVVRPIWPPTVGVVEDTATYQGPAAGLYASQNLLDKSASYGKFTATAQIEANFGD